ncbi:hypothetical protein [Flavilitoribacter nigricans]|uniref:Uncharacterized protein n=1 Tax=Flavilitoribacter nigricans (strain ATCC 23147 / DSM 23189 / NBRC 102662 / NCIMB 1420 / SS-2) TaxID=1122177 RepID=A0A2D0NET7_FLAN2|nr:hypothetical protein [Flavilitoribacter nigricans]PHN06995.1 hypothetical protein CRP01_08525 [Flavilitoribacter nigricans DSM 23189 = NBRC 102662]
MKKEKFYIVVINTSVNLDEVIAKGGITPNLSINEGKLKAIEFINYEDAQKVYQKIVQPLGLNNPDTNYWNFLLLNEIGFKEYIELKDDQKFTLQDLRNKEEEIIDLTKLVVQTKEPFGGGVIKGNKSEFTSPFNFWVNSVTKIIKDNFEIDADLYGGTYNPISLSTLEKLVTGSCGSLNLYLNTKEFVSAIELQNNSKKSGCFFVETENDYFLIDIHCH